jgi:hypothetical protein
MKTEKDIQHLRDAIAFPNMRLDADYWAEIKRRRKKKTPTVRVSAMRIMVGDIVCHKGEYVTVIEKNNLPLSSFFGIKLTNLIIIVCSKTHRLTIKNR